MSQFELSFDLGSGLFLFSMASHCLANSRHTRAASRNVIAAVTSTFSARVAFLAILCPLNVILDSRFHPMPPFVFNDNPSATAPSFCVEASSQLWSKHKRKPRNEEANPAAILLP
jgi:hypothetical protein